MIVLINVLLSLLIFIVALIGVTFPIKKIPISETFISYLFKFAGILSLLICALGIWRNETDINFSYLNIVNLTIGTESLWIYLIMSILLASVAHFSFQYIHKEIGFNKFFLNLALFWIGLFLFQFSGDNLVIFAGWELIGISSVFLISYYHYRKGPIISSLFVVSFYKFADILLITSLLFLKHNHLEGPINEFDQYLYLCLIIAGLIKSASFPFTAWLPKAMEGPTPSSAIFYAALSINTGVLLIYKFLPEILNYSFCKYMLIICGILTIAYSSIQSRVQSDIKSSLAYSTSSQIGFILIELALGFKTLALIHLFSSSIFKLYQFIRTPSLFHIYHSMEGEYGKVFGKTGLHFQYLLPKNIRKFLYYVSLNHFYLDWIYRGALQFFRKIGKLSKLLLFPIAGSKSEADYRSLLWGGYYILTVILVSIGAIEVKQIYFLIIPITIFFISSAMLFEKNTNTFVALFALYKVLESIIIHSVHSQEPYKILSILLAGIFAFCLIVLSKKILKEEGKLFYSSILVFMMLFFTNFPFLLQSLVNEHIIEAMISEGNLINLVFYCFANTFFNLGLYNFVFHKIYIEEAIDE